MANNKIIPSLWFHTEGGKLSIVTEYYKTIFGDDFQQGALCLWEKHPAVTLNCLK
jgi:hypothetical protein